MSTSNDVQIDPRGYRVGALITFVLAAVALVCGSSVAGIVLTAVLVALFIPGATVGPQATLQSFLFRHLIRPRIGAPATTESFRPPRFAQQMGLVMAVVALVGAIAGSSVVFYIFMALLTAASFLNGVFGLCLGCELYLLFKRTTTRAA